MEKKYSFLTDPRALAEIRKHKWLESQKQGQEVSFSAAALDWVKKFGPEWKRLHVKDGKDYRKFFERRKFRRFKLNCNINLVKNQESLAAFAKEISFFGLVCSSKDYLKPGSRVSVYLSAECGINQDLHCSTIVERALPVGMDNYEFFLKFDSNSRQEVVDCCSGLNN